VCGSLPDLHARRADLVSRDDAVEGGEAAVEEEYTDYVGDQFGAAEPLLAQHTREGAHECLVHGQFLHVVGVTRQLQD